MRAASPERLPKRLMYGDPIKIKSGRSLGHVNPRWVAPAKTAKGRRKEPLPVDVLATLGRFVISTHEQINSGR